MPVVFGLDLGTTSTAAVAMDAAGRLMHVVRKPHGAEIPGLEGGRAEQDPRRHLETAIALLRELAGAVDDAPVCLGLTGQMHSVLPVDSHRRPLDNVITWQDRRAIGRISGSDQTYLEACLSRCDESALADTGCRLSPGYAAVSLSALREQGRLPVALHRGAILADWIAAELSDAPIVTERSNAAATGVYDLRSDHWSSELIAACGLSLDWFPPVVDSGSIVGRLTQRMAEATGLPAGLPVCVPIGDNQASVLGSVPQGEPSVQITVGTGGQINWPLEAFERMEGLETRPLPPRGFLLVGAGLAGGDAFAWVNRTVRQVLAAFDVSRDDDEIYSVLTRLAASTSDGCDGLTCEPVFRGTRREPMRRGHFSGVGATNFSPGHLARAVLEGIASGFYTFWEDARDRRPQQVKRIIGCGNGLEQNPLLAEIIENRFQLPLFLAEHAESAACGAALLAGVSQGLWDSLEAAGAGIRLHRRVRRESGPDRAATGRKG